MNQISVIEPYPLAGTWVFDDERVALQAEPIVAGVPEIIDRVLCESGLEHAERFRLTFSGEPFPGCRRLSRREVEPYSRTQSPKTSGILSFMPAYQRSLLAAGNRARLDKGRRMNQISVIEPYLLAGTWVFDDERVGLQAEPFVAGVPEIIDRVLCESGLEHAERFRLTFSGEPFPGCRQLSRREAEFGGTWYQDVNSGLVGWLCPALFRYFASAPPELYCAAGPADRSSRSDPARPE